MRLAGPMPAQLIEDARRAVVGGRLLHAGLGGGAVGDVAGDGDAVDVDRHLGGGFGVEVEHRDLGAGGRQRARAGGAKAGGAAGDDCAMSFDFHGCLSPLRVGDGQHPVR